MNIVERVKNIIMTPKTEWDVIAGEATQPKDLVITYVLPLAALAAIAGFIGTVVIGSFFFGHLSFVWGLVALAWHLIMSVVSVFVIGFVIDALAPNFGGQKNFNQAIKVAAYSYTPGFIGGLFTIIPILGGFVGLLFALYGLYVMYLGLPKLMKNPEDKTVIYELVVIVVAIVIYMVIAMVGGMMTGGAMLGAAAISGANMPVRTYSRDSAAGKLDEFAKKMEEAGKKMEAAQKSGDPNKQMEAAMATLGTAMSGGKGVEPVQIDALKPFVPENFVGLPRKDMRTERGGAAGFVTAKAEGVYNDEAGKNAQLSVVDTGGMAGLMGVAAWMNVQGERENADRRESTHKEGKRFVHEEQNKRDGGTSKYTVVLNDRFIVEARGNVDFAKLKSAVNGLDLGKIESLK